MPHIIFNGTPDFQKFHEQFAGYRGDSNDWIIKIQHCLMAENNQTLIFDCTAVRSGFSQDFYLRAEQKRGSVTVRVDPYMRIEKNEGVQRAILSVSQKLHAFYPTLTFDKSNFPETVLPSDSF